MYTRAAWAELCLLGQNQNIRILGSFWPQAWPFIFITINERSHYKDIQCIIPAKVKGKTAIPLLSIIDIRVWREGKFVLTCRRPHSAKGLSMHACFDSTSEPVKQTPR